MKLKPIQNFGRINGEFLNPWKNLESKDYDRFAVGGSVTID
jgi:hypothetical protein